jgi:putative DNA primase/helicase
MPDGQLPDDDPIIQLEQIRNQRQTAAPPPIDPDGALPGTEDEVALEFSNRHAHELRYVNLWHRWLRWDGVLWRRVDDLSVFHLVRQVAREYAKCHNDKKLGRDAATAAIERAARNDPRHDRMPDIWDSDEERLITPNRNQ